MLNYIIIISRKNNMTDLCFNEHVFLAKILGKLFILSLQSRCAKKERESMLLSIASYSLLPRIEDSKLAYVKLFCKRTQCETIERLKDIYYSFFIILPFFFNLDIKIVLDFLLQSNKNHLRNIPNKTYTTTPL